MTRKLEGTGWLAGKSKSVAQEYQDSLVHIGGDSKRDTLILPPDFTNTNVSDSGEFSPTVPRWPDQDLAEDLKKRNDRMNEKLFPPTNVLDPINPSHYTAHKSGVDAITITEEFSFCLGNVIKYVWRAGLKSREVLEDLRKARWYLDREIARLEKAAKK